MKLSRRDLAALTLALEVCRDPYSRGSESWAIERAIDVLAMGGTFAAGLADWLAESRDPHRPVVGADHWDRPVLLRLALLLRTLLRVERGDYGRQVMRCTRCGEERGHDHCGCCSVHYGERWCTCWGAWRSDLHRIRPLWQDVGRG